MLCFQIIKLNKTFPPIHEFNCRSAFDNLELLKDGLPGALVTALVLGVHELGHILVANSLGIKLGVPFFVPSWQVKMQCFYLKERNLLSAEIWFFRHLMNMF